jgi:hypothetical protein
VTIRTAARQVRNALAAMFFLPAATLLGWWWLDPVIAPGIAGMAGWKGVEAWRGEDWYRDTRLAWRRAPPLTPPQPGPYRRRQSRQTVVGSRCNSGTVAPL